MTIPPPRFYTQVPPSKQHHSPLATHHSPHFRYPFQWPSFCEVAVSAALVDKREVRIRQMFNSIAPTYDLLNHLLSLNIDRYWRWRTTRLVPPRGDAPILDLCTGTGDLALAYDCAAGRGVPII